MTTAPTGRRLLALCIDWFLAVTVAGVLVGDWFDPAVNTLALGIFFLLRVGTGMVARSPGQALARLRVTRADGRRVDLLRLALRTGLLCLVIPAALTREGRGWHDRVADTVVSATDRA